MKIVSPVTLQALLTKTDEQLVSYALTNARAFYDEGNLLVGDLLTVFAERFLDRKPFTRGPGRPRTGSNQVANRDARLKAQTEAREARKKAQTAAFIELWNSSATLEEIRKLTGIVNPTAKAVRLRKEGYDLKKMYAYRSDPEEVAEGKYAHVDWSKTDSQLAPGLGVSRERVRQIRKRFGLTASRGRQIDWTGVNWNDQDEKIAAEYNASLATVRATRLQLAPEAAEALKGVRFVERRECYNVWYREFMDFWNLANNVNEVADKFGCTHLYASRLASRLRARGWDLKDMMMEGVRPSNKTAPSSSFVDFWNAASCVADVARHYNITSTQATNRAGNYRRRGRKLKRFDDRTSK